MLLWCQDCTSRSFFCPKWSSYRLTEWLVPSGVLTSWLNDLTRTSTTPGRVGMILSKESLEAAASAVSVSYPASTNFLMSSPLNFALGHLSSKTWRSALHSLSLSIRQRQKKELQEKQRKSEKMKTSSSACNAGKYLSPKTKHTRSDMTERNAMLALPNSHRKLCTRRAKDNRTIGKVASPVSGRPKTRGSRGEERQLSLPLITFFQIRNHEFGRNLIV